MLEQLSKLTSTFEFEDFGGILRIAQADFQEDDVILRLELRINGVETKVPSIRCHYPRAHRIIALDNWAGWFELSTDHAVLWPYTQPVEQLYFNGPVQKCRAVRGQLLLAHHQLFGEWIPVSRFLNASFTDSNFDLLRAPQGLLAKGPQSVIEAYREVLSEFGIVHSTLPSGVSKSWDGKTWQDEAAQLYALFIGNSYIVAPEFSELPPES